MSTTVKKGFIFLKNKFLWRHSGTIESNHSKVNLKDYYFGTELFIKNRFRIVMTDEKEANVVFTLELKQLYDYTNQAIRVSNT